MTYREQLLALAEELSITDEEAGEPQWAAYLTDDQLAEAIIRLRPEAIVIAGEGSDREVGILDGFREGMAIVRWEQGVVTPCPIQDLKVESL